MLTPPKRKWFALTVPNERVRHMNRKEYKEMSRWLRLTERTILDSLTFPDHKIIPRKDAHFG